jgi:hypothetical protein
LGDRASQCRIQAIAADCGLRVVGVPQKSLHFQITSSSTPGFHRAYTKNMGAAEMRGVGVRRLWRERRWKAIAWLGGIAAGAFWVYSGMPMICH